MKKSQPLTIHKDNKIGQGAFGSVYRVCQDDNCDLALKVFPQWYEDQYGECEGTSEAASAGLAPKFHGCFSMGGDNVGMLMDLHGISLLQYLVAERDTKKRQQVIESFKHLQREILERGLTRDSNNENYVVKECRNHILEPQVLGVDWVKLSPKKEEKKTSLLQKALLQKRIQDLVHTLEQEAEWIRAVPAREKIAQQKLKWLREWEHCT